MNKELNVTDAAALEEMALEEAVREEAAQPLEEAALEEMAQPQEIMESSAAIFELLSQLYASEPSYEFIEALRETRFPAHTGNERMDEGIWKIASYLSKTGDSATEELAADYCRTFMGAGSDSYSAAYPLESVHTGHKRLIMQGARDEVMAVYKAYGMEKSDRLRDGEDHIAYELDFMSVLASRTAELIEEGKADEAEKLVHAQLNFMDDHLLNWVPKLTKQMRSYSKTDFYHGVSLLTIGYLRENREVLQEMVAA